MSFQVEGKRIPELDILNIATGDKWLPIYDPTVDKTKRIKLSKIVNYLNIVVGSVNLSNLGDVNFTSLIDQQQIKYDSTSGKWINFTPPTAISGLTTGTIPVALSATTIGNSWITQSVGGIVITSGKTIFGRTQAQMDVLDATTSIQTQLNAKQVQLNGTGFVKATGNTISYDNSTYLTTISGISAGGHLSGTYPDPSLVNSAVTGQPLTGFISGAGTVSDTDSILSSIQKLDGNTLLKWGLNGNLTGNDTSFIGTIDNHDFLVKTNATTVASFLKNGAIKLGTSTMFLEQSSTIADWYINSVPIIQTKYLTANIGSVGIGIDANAAGALSIGGRTHLHPSASPYTDTIAFLNFPTRTASGENMWMKVNGQIGTGLSISGSPNVQLNVRSINEQLRLGYDASNYCSMTVASNGKAEFVMAGSAPDFHWKNGSTLIAKFDADSTVYIGDITTSTTAGQMFQVFGGTLIKANPAYYAGGALNVQDHLGNVYFQIGASQNGATILGNITQNPPAYNLEFKGSIRQTFDTSLTIGYCYKIVSTAAAEIFNISNTANIGIGTTTFGSSASGVIAQYDGTAPTTSPANTIQAYSENAVWKYRDGAGNIITI